MNANHECATQHEKSIEVFRDDDHDDEQCVAPKAHIENTPLPPSIENTPLPSRPPPHFSCYSGLQMDPNVLALDDVNLLMAKVTTHQTLPMSYYAE
jgi:hypothetical protein